MNGPVRAVPPRRSLLGRIRQHGHSLLSSLGKMMANPFGTLMTLLVLGVAMLLPLALHVAVAQLHGLDLQKERWGSLTIFLSPAIQETGAMELAGQIRNERGAEVGWISPEQGMAEFRRTSGFGQAMDLFEENPLPWVLLVTPGTDGEEGLDEAANRLAAWLEQQPGVDFIQADYKWLERLERIIAVGEALLQILLVVFSLAVVVIVANTIRLDVARRAEEIEVLHLVGAPGHFISQPFLYAGLWYGILGAAFALLMLSMVVMHLDGPMARLLESYGNTTPLAGLGPSESAVALVTGAVLGLAGSWLAVRGRLRQLRLE